MSQEFIFQIQYYLRQSKKTLRTLCWLMTEIYKS